MGNHTIDCEFCGKDRRTVGLNCCTERVEHDAREKSRAKAKADADEAYLRRIGLRPHMDSLGGFTRLYASDVVEALKKLERKGLLTLPDDIPSRVRRTPRV